MRHNNGVYLSVHIAKLAVQIPLLVLTSGIPDDAIATFIQRLLSSQASLADGVPAHKVLRLPGSTSAAFPAVLSTGLQWLASEAPPTPVLMVRPNVKLLQGAILRMDLSLWTSLDTAMRCRQQLLIGISDAEVPPT